MTSPVSSCSSEFDAAEVFADALMNQISREDVRNMVHTQRDMLSRFEKTNEMLINFNILSANRFAATNQEFKKHTQLLFEMKKDLDSVFKRIRIVKERLGKVYPDAFKSCGSVTPLLEEEEGEEESVTSSKSSQSIAENQSSRVNQSETAASQFIAENQSSRVNQSETADSQFIVENQSSRVNQSETIDNQSGESGQSAPKNRAESEKVPQEKTENQSAKAGKAEASGRTRQTKTKSAQAKSSR